MVSPGIVFVVLLNGLILVAGLLVYGYWRVHRTGDATEQPDPVEGWYKQAASLAREVQRTAESPEGPVDLDRMQRQVIPLSGRIQGHTRAAPAGVEERLVQDLYDLGVECYKVGMEHTTREAARTGVFLEDKLEELREDAEEVEAAISSHVTSSDSDSVS